MENLEEKVGIFCGGDERMETDFCETLALIFEMNSAGFVLNSEGEALSVFISKVVRCIKFNPTVWESEIKKEFADCLIEMASNPGWGKRVNLGAKEALLELSLAVPPISKKTKKEDKWFDSQQVDNLLYLLETEEDYRSEEACKALRR